ncbi:hypothetical protein [Streptosporangium sp. NPDC001681]
MAVGEFGDDAQAPAAEFEVVEAVQEMVDQDGSGSGGEGRPAR